MSIIDDEGVSNSSGNEHFQDILSARLSRRHLLTRGLATAAAVSLCGIEGLLKAMPASAQEATEDVGDADEGTEAGGRRKPGAWV